MSKTKQTIEISVQAARALRNTLRAHFCQSKAFAEEEVSQALAAHDAAEKEEEIARRYELPWEARRDPEEYTPEYSWDLHLAGSRQLTGNEHQVKLIAAAPDAFRAISNLRDAARRSPLEFGDREDVDLGALWSALEASGWPGGDS